MPETVVHENDTAVEIHNLQIIWLKNNAKNSKIPGDAVTSELSIKQRHLPILNVNKEN